ncbi:MAG: hypothetical protein Q7S89_01320 [bacterium]|nr:hypothetical protein [bacterium]
MKHFIALALFLFTFTPFMAVQAEETSASLEIQGDTFVVPVGETVTGNLYKAATAIEINGTIEGDLIAVAEVVLIRGQVLGDVLVLTERLHIDGTVSGDVRAVANTITINNKIGGNVTVAAAESLVVSNDVGRSLDFYAGECELSGIVGGNVHGAGQTCSMSGSVATGVWYKGDLSVGESARIHNGLTVWGQEPAIASGAIVNGGVVVHNPMADASAEPQSFVEQYGVFWKMVWLLGMLAVGFLFAFLMPKFLTRAVAGAKARIGLHFGVGALVLVLTPLVVLLLALTTIGIPLALILGVWYPVMLYVGNVIGACILGFLVLEKIQKKGAVKPVAAVTLGVVLFKVLTWVPFLGFWICLAATLVGVGSLALFKAQEIKRFQA